MRNQRARPHRHRIRHDSNCAEHLLSACNNLLPLLAWHTACPQQLPCINVGFSLNPKTLNYTCPCCPGPHRERRAHAAHLQHAGMQLGLLRAQAHERLREHARRGLVAARGRSSDLLHELLLLAVRAQQLPLQVCARTLQAL